MGYLLPGTTILRNFHVCVIYTAKYIPYVIPLIKFKVQFIGNPEQKERTFSLSIEEEAQYKDAFNVNFEPPGYGYSALSRLVAYEGTDGHTMGALKVSKDGARRTVYKHFLKGLFIDILTVTVSRDKIESFTCERLNPQGVSIQTLFCGSVNSDESNADSDRSM